MDQFTVPQFIDVEDKIFGPITSRQFVILIAAVGPILLAFKLADTALFGFLTFLIGGSALILAFVKINGQAFHYFLLNIVQTLRRPSRRLWFKRYSDGELRDFIKAGIEAKKPHADTRYEHKVLSGTRIRDLSLMVNTGGYYKPE
ncbi:MAG: PrgI family protein [Patescibacteria group bacterium]